MSIRRPPQATFAQTPQSSYNPSGGSGSNKTPQLSFQQVVGLIMQRVAKLEENETMKNNTQSAPSINIDDVNVILSTLETKLTNSIKNEHNIIDTKCNNLELNINKLSEILKTNSEKFEAMQEEFEAMKQQHQQQQQQQEEVINQCKETLNRQQQAEPNVIGEHSLELSDDQDTLEMK